MRIAMLTLLVVVLFAVVAADKSGSHKNEIVDANHYYSEQNREKVYKITPLQKGKPLAIVIKPTGSSDYSNTITLTLNSGSKSKQCAFKSYDDLCVLDSVESDQGELGIKCKDLPCDVSWKIYQPNINELATSENVSNLYRLPSGADRIMLALSCKSVADASEKQDRIALAFSSVPFRTVKVNAYNSFIFFDQVKQGYLYLIVNPRYKSCANMKVTKGAKAIAGDIINDFIVSAHKNQYQITDAPDNKQFRFDLGFHQASSIDKQKTITVSVTGEKDGSRSVIRQNKIALSPTFGSFDISYAVPKIKTSDWKNLKLEVASEAEIVIFEAVMSKADRIEVEATQFSYFDLKKGEKLPFRLIKQKNAPSGEKVKISLSDEKSLKATQSSCSLADGCQFQVEALVDVQGNIYIGQGSGKTKQIITLDMGKSDSITHKIKELESVYIKKKLEVNKAIQVIINSPNVVVYFSPTKKCPTPSQTCYEKAGNINKHFIYYPDSQDQTDVIFLVNGLDTCEFTLTLLTEDTDFITLKDSQPFVYMLDKQEKVLKFRFKRTSKVDVSFNLIAPLHALDLIVENGKKIPNDEEAIISAEGFLQFKANKAPKDEFTILVRKREGYQNKFVHFTLIASTKGKMIRLESGITHYETLTKSIANDKNNAEYIFEFDPEEQYSLNFYAHNTKEEDVDIKLLLKALGENKKDEPKTVKLVIDKSSDVLSLNDVSKELCADVDDDDACEISMELQNNMDFEVDIAITLLNMHAIIELKDGIWQSYSLSAIAKSAHFYFIPRNHDHDISLMYKATDPALRLKYRLFYAENDAIDPTEWPFPSEDIDKEQKEEQARYKPIKHFGISKSTLQACWPNCVVLISIIDLEHKDKEGNFNILASNSIMELPEKQKIDITLKEGETKAYLIDLKYALEIEQNIYIYTYHSIGLTDIYANVYSEKNDRVPDGEIFDFDLNTQNEVVIPVSAIKDIIKSQEMDDHLNYYLYISVSGLSDCKISIEFSFNEVNEPNQKLISIDTMEHVMMLSNSFKIFYMPAVETYEVKVSRLNGFPFYYAKTCRSEIDSCLSQMRDDKQKGQQILTKVAAFTAQPCEQCFYIFKISTEQDPSEVDVHLQSMASEVELTENKPLYDFTEKGEENKYVFYAIKGEDIFVNVHVTEGEIEVEITDFNQINKKKSGGELVSFVIPTNSPNDASGKQQKVSKKNKQLELQEEKEKKKMESIAYLKKENPMMTTALMSAFGLSDSFMELHITIKSKDPKKPSIYTLTYSSGEAEYQLQDGLITDYNLEPNKEATFYYSSRVAGHVYLTLSMEKSSYLKDLDIALKYCDPKGNIIEDDCWVTYNTEKPPIKDKTPNPTIMYSLMDKNHLSVALKYKGSKNARISLGINHQEIMILPFEVEFPFILHKGEKLSFLVELSNPGYIEIITRKCDQSNPVFSYTFDYDAFQKDEYTYEAELGINPKNRFVSKVKPGTLYMKIQTPPEEQSMVSILVRYSEQKIKDADIYPGNKGDVEYSIVDSSNGELLIKPPVCSDSQCNGKFKYYLMTSDKMRDLYSQLVCPSNFFSNAEFYSGEPIKQSEVTPRQNSDGTLSIPFKLLDQISYIGLKVTDNKGKQVFYKPVEVATLWGQLSRTSHSHKLAISAVFICSILAIVICVRRNARKGYRPIEDQA